MKPKYPETKRKRIILIYSLAIVLPGILMGIMAYQGILNDQARRSQESHERLAGTSDDFFYAFDSLLVAELNGIQSDDFSTENYPDYIRLAFLQTEKPDLHLIHHHLIFVPDSIESTLSDKIDKDLLDLLSKARAHKNKKQYQNAFDTWLIVEKDYAKHLLNNKLPLVLVAQLEQIKTLQFLRKDSETTKAIHKLYSTLLNPPCSYEASQFRFFWNELENMQLALNPEIKSIREEVLKKGEESGFLIRMISERDPVFLLSKQDPAWPGIYKYLLAKDSLQTVYLSIEKPNYERLGCLIDIIPFIEENANRVMSRLDPNKILSWEVSDSSKSEYSSFRFSEYYPDIILNLKENELTFLNSLTSKGQGLYLLIFAFIAGLMALGLVFTIYTLNHELKLNRLKSDFISNVSHELKSPLTSIRHLTDLLHTNRVKTEDQKKKYYATMLDQTEHLSYLIDNILDFSRLEDHRKKFRFQEVNYKDLLDKWMLGFKDRLQQAGIELSLHIPDNMPNTSIDPDAMQQVIQNLIDNAIKYSGVGKKIDINVQLKGKEIITSISDQGLGVSKKDQNKIFDRFYRCEESQKLGIKGSGIGLTIVQRVIVAHHGRIDLESESGKGSTFTITLPVNQNDPHEKNTAG